MVPKNLTVLQACNQLQIVIPRFCFQRNLQIAGNCRMCLVEIKNSPKPIASCAMPVMQNMEIFTNTPLIQKARESVLEFLLINHPLDCPICDQASECDLQDQTLMFGSDKTRFFFLKRQVEDKYFGPFIKTIMTRCIHCTRCVRFANEISVVDDLGTTGRGNKTEINFYYSKILNSEFSGNLIDLCPVGALTSKPFAFKGRSWEIQKLEGIDILDSAGSNIILNKLNNKIIRIVPKTNFDINMEWISNKTRFFFDSLYFQRVEHPLLKVNNKFVQISWNTALNIINKNLTLIDSSKIQIIIGDLIDLEALFLLKKTFVKLGVSNIVSENAIKPKLNNDLTSNFLMENSLKSIENSDLCLIINSDIRVENPILNLHLLNRYKKGNFKIYNIGNNYSSLFPISNIGLTLNTLFKIIKGNHYFCKLLQQSKNPLIIFGENIINVKNGLSFITKIKNLFYFKNKNVNFLNTKTTFINYLETNFYNSKKNIRHPLLNFLFNTNNNLLKKPTINEFRIYQGHHFTKNAQDSNLILPGLTFLEKSGTYLNLEGIIQRNNKILNLNTHQRKDVDIFKALYVLILSKHKKKVFNNFHSLNNTFQIAPYLLTNSKLKIIKNNEFKIINNNYHNFKFNLICFYSLTKNMFYSNILEQYSKTLINSKKTFKLRNNLKQYL